MKSILVADDQLAMRNMFKNILEMEGFSIDLANDGEQAYKAATQKKYDLVITDLYMPKKTGIELTQDLRGLSSYIGVPILIVSTESSTDKMNAGKKAGANGWIVKPVTKEKLEKVINKLLK